MEGWWPLKTTARDKCREWLGEFGGTLGARITLLDDGTSEALALRRVCQTSDHVMFDRVAYFDDDVKNELVWTHGWTAAVR
jgi:hypothetical protein